MIIKNSLIIGNHDDIEALLRQLSSVGLTELSEAVVVLTDCNDSSHDVDKKTEVIKEWTKNHSI